MRDHPGSVLGWHTPSGAVCYDCARALPDIISGPREAVRTADRDVSRTCLACGECFAGPRDGFDASLFHGEGP